MRYRVFILRVDGTNSPLDGRFFAFTNALEAGASSSEVLSASGSDPATAADNLRDRIIEQRDAEYAWYTRHSTGNRRARYGVPFEFWEDMEIEVP